MDMTRQEPKDRGTSILFTDIPEDFYSIKR